MSNVERDARPRFYFAASRLIAAQFGWSAQRCEGSWLEANLVGGLEHLIWFAFAAHLLFHRAAMWQKLALLMPAALLLWLGWLLVLYVNSVVIGLLRSCGLLRDFTNARVQSVLLGIVTTAFAFQLLNDGSVSSVFAFAWMAVVAVNLLAAAVLLVTEAVSE
ncbi:MAG: hypothetical protein M3Z22_07675 [Verrucomicrobiota bacterium]|nr:hypothetical protein [Verrucomicrobiota bacterium]